MAAETGSLVAPLALEEAKKLAAELGINQSFAEKNIFRVLLHRPRVAKAVADLLGSLAFKAELDERLRELVIMRVGWRVGADYEWTQHWVVGQRCGCTPQELEAVREWRRSTLFGEPEQLVLQATDETLESGRISRETWQRCEVLLGGDATLELIMAIEEEFSVEIPNEVAENIRTVSDAVDYVSEMLAA